MPTGSSVAGGIKGLVRFEPRRPRLKVRKAHEPWTRSSFDVGVPTRLFLGVYPHLGNPNTGSGNVARHRRFFIHIGRIIIQPYGSVLCRGVPPAPLHLQATAIDPPLSAGAAVPAAEIGARLGPWRADLRQRGLSHQSLARLRCRPHRGSRE